MQSHPWVPTEQFAYSSFFWGKAVSVILNLLGAATIILAIGLIVIGKWVRKEMITKAVVAQGLAMLCVIVAAFMLK